jgi:hypothetical protein
MNLKKALCALLAVASLATVATSASAQQDEVTVVLPDGRTVRGVVLVVSPPRSEERSGTVNVHLDTTSDLALERLRGSEWVTVCTAPCDLPLPFDGYYRVTGASIRDSKPFRFEGASGDHLVLTPSTGSATAYDTGIFLTVTGGLGLSAAGWLLYYELINSIDYHSQGVEKGTALGLELGGASALVTTLGIVLIAGNPQSTVTQSSQARGEKSQTNVPAPSWRAHEFRGLPAASMVPIFSGTF